jgi:UDP-glucose 4-epimerase
MHILVTGGAGYIGSATAAAFLNAGHTVTVLDNLIRGHREAVPEGAHFVHGDISDRGTLRTLFQMGKFDAVAHFAALMEAGESMKYSSLYFRSNVSYSQTLLEAMIENGVKRLVFSSTAATFAAKNAPLNEDDPQIPANLYGETKLMIERMIAWHHRVDGLNYCILRYFNACGAMLDANGKVLRGEAHQPETHLIPLTLQVPLGQRQNIGIFGTDYPTFDGTCVRDYIHIEDLASAHVLSLEAMDERRTMTYNLGNGQGYSVRQVIDTAREVTGMEIPTVELPRREGDAPVLVASAEKINDELGWVPRYRDLQSIISSSWEWHRTHPNGYAD